MSAAVIVAHTGVVMPAQMQIVMVLLLYDDAGP